MIRAAMDNSYLLAVFCLVVCQPHLAASADDLTSIRANEASRCADEPGSSPSYRIVTQTYYDIIKGSKGSTAVANFKISTSNAPRYRIKNGCPIYFGMMQHEAIFVEMVRDGSDSILLSEWEHEGSFTTAYMSFKRGTDIFETARSYGHKRLRLQGQQTWTEYDNYWFWHDQFFNPNYGPDNPLVMELTSEYAGAGMGVQFAGMWKFTFHVTDTIMTEESYQAIKALFMTNCAPFRGGFGPAERYSHSVSNERLTSEEWANLDALEGCSWQDPGFWWNETEYELTNYKGLCSRYLWDVYCDHEGNVVMLQLGSQNLQGKLPAALADLKHLEYVDLRFNQLEGPVPTVWHNHPTMHFLDLEHNQFTGSLPCFESKELDVLRLNTNLFKGTLPPCLKKLTKLQVLDVSANDMHGSLPDDFSELTDLQKVYLEQNHFGGSLPASMCRLSKLTHLDIHTNKISGQFPRDCLTSAGWAKLSHVNVGFNRMSGSVPTLGDLNSLVSVILSHNYFEGTVTHQFDSLLQNHRGSFTEILVDGNMLSGPFPEIAYNMTFFPLGVDSFSFIDNLFRCERNGRFPDWTIRAPHSRFGTCTPVPNPKTVDPTVGKAGDTITVDADDIMPNAHPSCRFSQGSTSAIAAGNVVSGIDNDPTKKKIQCFVPTALSQSEGTFQVTVANFGTDYASAGLVVNFNPPAFQLLKAPVVTEGVQITSSVQLQGTTTDFDEPRFREMIVNILGNTVPATAITTSWEPYPTPSQGGASSRRLQTSSYTVYFAISLPLDPEANGTTTKVNDIKTKLANSEVVREAMMSSGFTPVNNNYQLAAEHHAIHDSVSLQGSSSSSESKDIVPGLIGAIIGAVLITCFCSCICFIRYREKKGRPYFAEMLDEGNTGASKAGGAGGDTGAKYGIEA